MKKKSSKRGLIRQISVLFAIAVVVTGFLTFLSQKAISDNSVKNETELLAGEVADETRRSIQEFPAYEWLLSYWYQHADMLEVEYDVDFSAGTVTEEKCRLLLSHAPDLQLRYATTEQIEALPAEDQKLYAEITYSWLITRLDQIKQTYQVDFLFGVITDSSYQTQMFLFSAADEGSVRGTEYEQVYILGTTVTVSWSQQEAMQSACKDNSHLANAGKYVDYYVYLGEVDGQSLLIGMTYNTTDLRARIGSQTWRGTAFAMVYQICLSFFFLWLILMLVLIPLKTVQENIYEYKNTKDSKAVAKNLSQVRPDNELGQLSEDIIDLTKEVDDYLERIETITAEKERIGVELSLATRIQSSMLPHVFPAFPERTEFDLYASMNPAKEVGGDFYDYFLIDADHLGLVIADVSGKGIPAALFMMISKTIIKNYTMLSQSPAEVLGRTNEAICANNQEEMFVTVWLGILEISTGRLVAANAGHEYPVLKAPDGQFALVRDRHGLVVGGMEGISYKEYELQLQPGSTLFLYTDGVPEATDANGKMFGTERMLAALNKDPDSAPQQVLSRVQTAVDAFVKDAEQFDDLTMLCMEYRGNQGSQNASSQDAVSETQREAE